MRILLAGVALASLCAVALGPGTATGREAGAGSVDLGEALAVARDGKLVVAGLSHRGSPGGFAIARYTADGALDRRFGTGGKVLTRFGGAGSYGGATSLAIGSDGKVVVAGWVVSPGTGGPFALARYTVAGKLDRTFGQNGKVLTGFGGNAKAVAIQADGKVVAVGSVRSRFALARYTSRGRLDRSFGRGGKVLTDFGLRSISSAYAVAIQQDRKIVVAGDRDGMSFALARYAPDGTLDRSFGKGGRVLTKVGNFNDHASALIVQRDGKLVVAGRAFTAPDGDFALIRYRADGKLDPSFGDGGIVTSDAGNASGLTVQRDGKLVTAGVRDTATGYPGFALARFLEDGSLDPSFGRDGKLLTDFHRQAVANALVVRADGKLVVAGTISGRDFALARYSSDGRLDGSFGRGGKVVTDFGSIWAKRAG